MKKLIFDKDNQFAEGLTPAILRDFATKDGVAEGVPVNTIRYDRLATAWGYTPKTKVSTVRYNVIGGGDVFIARSSTVNEMHILEGDGEGGFTLLKVLERVLTGTGGTTAGARGSSQSANIAFGINGQTHGGKDFDNTPALDNHIVNPLSAATYYSDADGNSILRVLCSYCRHNGTVWLYAGHMTLYSTDKGDTWSVEYVSAETNLGIGRVREWAINNKPTPVYARGDLRNATMIFYGDADYLSKQDGGTPGGAFTVSAWAKIGGAWVHQGAVEFDSPGNAGLIEHNHVARVVECEDGVGKKGLQVVLTEGDGTAFNQVTRWTFFATGDVDPSDPSSISGFDNPANWDFDDDWDAGISAFGGQAGTRADQFIFTYINDVEGEFLTGSDINAKAIHCYNPGPSTATAPIKKVSRDLDWNGNQATVFYGGQDEEGRRMICRAWDNIRLGSGFTNREIRIFYSDDWGLNWSYVGTLDNKDNNIIISHGYAYWNNGQSGQGEDGLFSMPLPTRKLQVRPAMVSPGGLNLIYDHDVAQPTDASNTNWMFLSGSNQNWATGVHPSNGGSSVLIARTVGGANDGLFVDPVTSEIYPEPPVPTNYIIKVVVPEETSGPTSGTLIRAWLTRRMVNDDSAFGNVPRQADSRFWVMNVSKTGSCGFVAYNNWHIPGGNNQAYPFLDPLPLGSGANFRSGIALRSNEQWQPVYGATLAAGITTNGPRGPFDLKGPSPDTEQTFLLVPDFFVPSGGGRVNIPLPYSAGTDQTYMDESLTVDDIGFDDGVSFRTVCRVPWSAWCGYSDQGDVNDKTMWRLYEDADNWIVAEWNATIGGVRIRVKADGATVETLDLAGTNPLRVNRDQTVDLIIARDGTDLVAAVNMDGERYSGTLAGALEGMPTLDDWKAGADEDDEVTAWNFMAIEVGDKQTEGDLETALQGMPQAGDPEIAVRIQVGNIPLASGDTWNWGTVPNEQSEARSLVIRNDDGDADLIVNDVLTAMAGTSGGVFAIDPDSAAFSELIPPDSELALTILFNQTNTELSPGVIEDTLSIATNDPDSPFIVELRATIGNGDDPQPVPQPRRRSRLTGGSARSFRVRII